MRKLQLCTINKSSKIIAILVKKTRTQTQARLKIERAKGYITSSKMLQKEKIKSTIKIKKID